MKHAVRLVIVVAALVLIGLIMLPSSRHRGEPVTLHLLSSTNDAAGNMIGLFSVSNHYDHFIQVHANSNGIPLFRLTEFLKVPGETNAFIGTNYHEFYTGKSRWQTLASGEGVEFSVVVPNGAMNATLQVSYLSVRDHTGNQIEKLVKRVTGIGWGSADSAFLQQPFVQEPVGQ